MFTKTYANVTAVDGESLKKFSKDPSIISILSVCVNVLAIFL